MNIRFISYSGEYPNLCSGVLTVFIDDIEYKFGHNYLNHHYNAEEDKWYFANEDPNKPNYPAFWSSGGNVWFSGDWDAHVESGPWYYTGDLDEYPEFTEEIIEKLMEVFNNNVEYGCCGGCI